MVTDNSKIVQYDIRKKSMGVAYVFWIFLSGISAHRFYTGNILSAILQLGLLIFSLISFALLFPFGMFLFSLWFLWIFLDLFLVAHNVKKKNLHIAAHMGITV